MRSLFYPVQWSRSNITLIFIYILKFDIKKPATQSTEYLNVHIRLVLNEAKGFSHPLQLHWTVCFDSVIKISIYWKISQDHHQFGPSKHAELHYTTVWKDMPVTKVPALVTRLFLLFLHQRRTFPWASVAVGWASDCMLSNTWWIWFTVLVLTEISYIIYTDSNTDQHTWIILNCKVSTYRVFKSR